MRQAVEDLLLTLAPMLDKAFDERDGVDNRPAVAGIIGVLLARQQLAQAIHVMRHVAVGR